MNLTELQIKAELRSKWQAIDLGIAMAKRWYLPMFLSWLIPAVIIFTGMNIFFWESPWVAILTVWWLKPLFDRLPLFLLSRYLFNEATFKQLNLKSLFKLYCFDLLSALTWRRLDFRRSFSLAITILEKQKGLKRSKRYSLLQQGCGNAATWLTLVLVHLEMLVCLGFISLIILFIPQDINWDFFRTILDNSLLFEHIYNSIYVVSVCLIAPFYVACGFSLYINRRIELEAWDLELIFRHSMEKRTEGNALQATVSSLAAICLSASLLLPSTPVQAEQTYPNTAKPVDPVFIENIESVDTKQEILSILESPPFVIEKQVTEWQLKPTDHETDSDMDLPEWLKNLEDIDGFSGFIKGAALVIEIAIWVAIALLVFFLLKSLVENLDLRPGSKRTSKITTQDKPEVIMGLVLTTESLPNDIEAAMSTAINDGDNRLALSLLYRYSLYQLIHHHNVPLENWHTEYECSAIVAQHLNNELSQFFTTLTLIWQQQAYAHITPDMAQMKKLCSSVVEVMKP
ncbi:hypothetical protein [Neptuniibacter sp.]|uniref:hypothetical protein n=1 Tax=Neptuniibacter sp. TaxID=1962643 RepID=UPI002618963C|nr:hypothetical protein [Neptuniibacter sp.]MCP4597237.1 hypothetical protein [Neptuniibacter sp.]